MIGPLERESVAELDIEATIEVGQATEVGVNVRAGGGRKTRIFWNRAQLGNGKPALCLDRTNAGSDPIHKQPNQPFTAAMSADNGQIQLRILVDRSSVEVFAREYLPLEAEKAKDPK